MNTEPKKENWKEHLEKWDEEHPTLPSNMNMTDWIPWFENVLSLHTTEVVKRLEGIKRPLGRCVASNGDPVCQHCDDLLFNYGIADAITEVKRHE